MKAIVAVDKKWGIGKKNDLLFNLPLDMKFFRETTAGTTVCMGYNTLLSFPNSKPLPKRKNVVLCPEGIERDDAASHHKDRGDQIEQQCRHVIKEGLVEDLLHLLQRLRGFFVHSRR